MRPKTTVLGLLLLLALVPLLQGCGNDGPPRIGVLLPLTGDEAAYGEPVQRGVELARSELEEARSLGLYPFDVEVEVLDTGGDPERAAELLQHFYDRGGAAAVAGVTDAELAALVPIADEAERVLISPTASRPDLPTSRHVYRVALTADREATKMASFTALELGLDEVALLVAEDPTAQAAADAFQDELERNRGEILARLSYGTDGEIPQALARKAVATEAPAIYVADFGTRGEAMIQALDRQGFRGIVLATSALTAPKLLDASRQAADGALVTQTLFDLESDNPKIEVFTHAYRERWDEEPDLYAAHGYDAFQVLTQALAAEEGRSAQVWKGIRGLDEYRGVTGYLQFDEQGRAGKFPRVYVVDGGQLDPVEGMPDWRKQRLARRAP